MKFLEDKCCSDPSDIQQEESSDLSDISIRLPRLEVQQQEETPADSPPQNPKTRSLRELYEKTLDIDDQIKYALFSYQPTYFDEVVKDAQWIHTMNE